MQLQRTHSRNNDGRIRFQARRAALDVEESLGSHIRPASRLGDEVLTSMNPNQVGENRRVAVRDVTERAGVDEDRRVLESLEQVWLYRISHDHRHGARRFELLGRDRFPFRCESHDCPTEARPQVVQRRGEREHSHDL